MPKGDHGPLRSITEVIGEYPFCVGLTTWGLVVGPLTLLDHAPSASMSDLPKGLQIGWGLAIFVSAASMLAGLIMRRNSLLIVRALFLFATTFGVYGAAVAFAAGWSRGGGTASLMLIFGFVCVIRSRYLRKHFRILHDEACRKHSPNGGGEGS
jgi:hypothetical protein